MAPVIRSLALAIVIAASADMAIAQSQPRTPGAPSLPADGADAPSLQAQLAALQARLAQQQQALDNHRKLLAQAREEIALKDELLALGRTRNRELYQQAIAILDRYANVGVTEALSRREPFIQSSRVALENRVQDYEDRLRAARFDEHTLPPSVEQRMQEELDRRRAQAAAEAAANPPAPDDAAPAGPAADEPSPPAA